MDRTGSPSRCGRAPVAPAPPHGGAPARLTAPDYFTSNNSSGCPTGAIFTTRRLSFAT
jgi:hypothetical protein